jgi:hypothetical protein
MAPATQLLDILGIPGSISPSSAIDPVLADKGWFILRERCH